jgi:hypothetical protein
LGCGTDREGVQGEGRGQEKQLSAEAKGQGEGISVVKGFEGEMPWWLKIG